MTHQNLLLLISFVLVFAHGKAEAINPSRDNLRVSDNRHFLVHADGTPFFYLGDTAWEFLHRGTKEDANYYLRKRAAQGFTVIQTVALAEFDGLNEPNAYGFRPFENNNPDKIAIKSGCDNDYWDYVDFFIRCANNFGLYVGLLPSWGSYWNNGNPVLNEDNARRYGRFLGERYKDAGIIWILGGDRPADRPEHLRTLRELAGGIRDSGAKQLITFHPCGGNGSAQWLHNEQWLDFNMRQNGHSDNYTERYYKTYEDYCLTPAKPVLDGEPIYEGHPINFDPEHQGHSTAADVRHAFYWDVFNGACGHTYGHHSIWQMYDGKRDPVNVPLMIWKEALLQPGSQEVCYGKLLIESRPQLTRIPAPELIVKDRVPTSIPGAGRYRFTATCDEAGTYVMVYIPAGRTFKINTSQLKATRINVWWFNPRNGHASKGKSFNNTGIKQFQTPTPGEDTDWVLILDDASKHYASPGQRTPHQRHLR